MDFNFTEEQSMLRDALASFLQDKYSFDTRRASVKSASGWRADYWKAFAEELGILGAPFSEELGGLGGVGGGGGGHGPLLGVRGPGGAEQVER